MSELLELADRVESATGPDRELDEEIFVRLNPGKAWRLYNAPRYSASIDAAMSLADGFGFQVVKLLGRDSAAAFLWDAGTLAVEATAATPALALCSAALRARAAQIPEIQG